MARSFTNRRFSPADPALMKPFSSRSSLRRVAIALLGSSLVPLLGSSLVLAADTTAAPATKIAEHGRWVIAADYAKDGGLLLTVGGESLLYRPGDVTLWKGDGTRIGDLVGHPTSVWAARISKDGSLAATAGYDGLVKVWDVASRTLKHDLKKHKGWCRTIDFSPDGKLLATGGEDGSVVLWDAAAGTELKTIAAGPAGISALAFSPDGAVLATGGGDPFVKLWDVATAAEKGKLEGHEGQVWAIRFAPDGATLATGADDRTIRLWNAADGKPVGVLEGHVGGVTSLDFSTDGSRLVSGDLHGSVKLWDVKAKGEQEGPEKGKSSVWVVRFAPGGRSILAGTHAGALVMATPAPKLLPPKPPKPPKPTPPPVAVTPTPAQTTPAPQPAPVASVPDGTPLKPTEFKSAAGATATIADDGSVLVAGPLAKDTYTFKTVLPAGVAVKGFVLEALPDPSLPLGGPGRSPTYGNFVLSEIRASYIEAGKDGAGTPLKFATAQADFDQDGYGSARAIDGNDGTGWAVHPQVGKPHWILVTIAPDVKLPAGATVSFALHQQHVDSQHALGKFRLRAVKQ